MQVEPGAVFIKPSVTTYGAVAHLTIALFSTAAKQFDERIIWESKVFLVDISEVGGKRHVYSRVMKMASWDNT